MHFSLAQISICSGIIFLIVYVTKTLITKKSKELNLAEAIIIIISGTSVLGGGKVCLLAFESGGVCNSSEIEQIYIFLGGITVVWASVSELYLRLFK